MAVREAAEVRYDNLPAWESNSRESEPCARLQFRTSLAIHSFRESNLSLVSLFVFFSDDRFPSGSFHVPSFFRLFPGGQHSDHWPAPFTLGGLLYTHVFVLLGDMCLAGKGPVHLAVAIGRTDACACRLCLCMH